MRGGRDVEKSGMQYNVTPEIRQNSIRSKKICDVAFS